MKKIPHTYVIIFYLIVIAAVMTWFIPGGHYVKKTVIQDGEEKQEIVYETKIIDGHEVEVPKFEFEKSNPQTWQIFSALFKGFTRQSGIIAFIFIVGGAFWIVNSTNAINVGIFEFLNFTAKLEKSKLLRKIGVNNIMLVLIMLIFSIFGAVFGMSEETIAFIVILVPLAISMGYDSITGVAIVFVAAGLGFAGAMLNPFTIGIAQGIAGLPLFSGIEFRTFCWLVINIVGISYILWYANRVKKNPKISPVYQEDEYWRKRTEESHHAKIEHHTPKSAWIVYFAILLSLAAFSYFYPQTTIKFGQKQLTAPLIPIFTALFAITSIPALSKSVHFFILNILAFTIVYLIIGVMGYGWYIMEIASLFFAMGLLSGIAYGYDGNRITKEFLSGAKDILSAALVVGLAGGIIIILEDGNILETILWWSASKMDGLGDIATVGAMYVIQTFLNILIPSGSAKAAITMPIMAPFSEYIGLSKQATVMAYQFGDGFTNLITPTSGVLIGVLEVAKIPYEKWFKWILPLIIALIILGFILLVPTVKISLPGF